MFFMIKAMCFLARLFAIEPYVSKTLKHKVGRHDSFDVRPMNNYSLYHKENNASPSKFKSW